MGRVQFAVSLLLASPPLASAFSARPKPFSSATCSSRGPSRVRTPPPSRAAVRSAADASPTAEAPPALVPLGGAPGKHASKSGAPGKRSPQQAKRVVERFKEYAPIREMGFNRSNLISFFSKKPQVVAVRLAVVTRTLNLVKKEWEAQEGLPRHERTRGAILREELSGLGPCFVKIGQTLSQRPDIVGEEAAEELKSLQTENEPFADDVAMEILASELGWTAGPVAPGVAPHSGCEDPAGPTLFKAMSLKPIASASLGQVYKAELWDGRSAAVKVQRPEAVRQVCKRTNRHPPW